MQALVLTACDSGSGATGPDGPGGTGPDIGIITDLPAPARLAGTWVRDDEIDHFGAPALRSTEWRFDGRGTCRRTVTIFTADGVFPIVDESICGYEADGRAITLRFDEGEMRLRWSLDGGDVLVLDGDRFHRFRG